MSKLTVEQFFERFPTDDACLDRIMNVCYGMRHTCMKCSVVDSTFHRLANRRAYSCAHCGVHLYPCVGTIFQDSSTKLQLWFYAIYLIVVVRHVVSAKELERQLGVTYKCAWRMGHKIREQIQKTDFHRKLVELVEIDEAYVAANGRANAGTEEKTIVV